jgi:hypothetical protein
VPSFLIATAALSISGSSAAIKRSKPFRAQHFASSQPIRWKLR